MLERMEDAIINFTKAIEINPKLSNAYFKRGIDINYIQGIILNYLKREQEAIIDFTKSIEIDPNLPDAYYNRGRYFSNYQDLHFIF